MPLNALKAEAGLLGTVTLPATLWACVTPFGGGALGLVPWQ